MAYADDILLDVVYGQGLLSTSTPESNTNRGVDCEKHDIQDGQGRRTEGLTFSPIWQYRDEGRFGKYSL